MVFGAVVGAIYYDLDKGPNGLQNRWVRCHLGSGFPQLEKTPPRPL